jgi:hypothetical protein
VEVVTSKQVYANAWMAIREDMVRRSDASTGLYSVVESPDIALVIPADDDRLQLVEQYRHPVAGRRWAFLPAARMSSSTPVRRRWRDASCTKKLDSRRAF